jgi:hypothetical protein
MPFVDGELRVFGDKIVKENTTGKKGVCIGDGWSTDEESNEM